MENHEVLQTQQLAQFGLRVGYDNIHATTIDQLKRHLLDALGSFIHAPSGPPIQKLIKQIQVLEPGLPLNKLPADRMAQLYTALIRYPDFMDNFLAKESTCHPSDTIGPLLAATQLKDISGKDFLAAMAIAYQVECRLVKEIPVMIKGFDHTLLLAYAVVLALSKLLKLNDHQTAHALGMAGCSTNPLVTCRASYTFEWKGIASSLVAMNCMQIVLLAKEDMTGPVALFEKPEKGFNAIFGMTLDYDWSTENFELIPECILKSYNAEVHTQSSIEAILELRKMHDIDIKEIKQIDVTTFLTAYHIVGGGEYGDRKTVASKEQADHSLPYVLAVALLDGQVYPDQLLSERIHQRDVQELLQKVHVHTSFPLHKPVKLAGLVDKYTAAYPEKVCTEVCIELTNGTKYKQEKESYKGFHDNPFTWEDCIDKFRKLTASTIDETQQDRIINHVQELEKQGVISLCEQLQLILLSNAKVEAK